MLLRNVRQATILVIVLSLSSLCFAQAQKPKAPDDEATLRSLTEQYFAAYASKDVTQAMSFWTPLSDQFEPKKKKLRELFAANSETKVSNLVIGRPAVDSRREEASVRVELTLHALDAKTGKPAAGFGRMNRTLTFSTKEKDIWKLWRETASEIEDLAEALVAAKTDEERRALLASNKELQTRELRESLTAQGDRFAAEGEVVNPNKGWFYLPKDYQRALLSYQLAQSIAEDLTDKIAFADIVRRTGDAHYRQSKDDLAVVSYKQALGLYEALGDKRGIAHALHGIANIYQRQSKYGLQIEHCWKVLALRDALGKSAADQIILAHAHSDIASIYSDQGKYDLALDYYQKALALYETAGDKRHMGIVLWLMGNTQRSAPGNDDLAFDYYKKSVALIEASGHKLALANVLISIQNSYLLNGNFGLALEYSQKSLATFEALGLKSRIPLTLVNLGIVHYMQGSYDLAMEYYQKALSKTMEHKEPTQSKERASWDIAWVLERIGRTHLMLGDYNRALENSHKAITEYKASGYASSRSRIAFISTDIGDVHLKRAEYDLALQYYQQALAVDDANQNDWGESRALNGIGEIHLRRGNYAQALDFASRSAAVFKQGAYRGNPLYGLLQSRTIAGKAHHRLNQPAEARQAFEAAISHTENVRTQVVGGEQERRRFFEGGLAPYHAMVEFLIAQKNASEALTYAERAKARVLLDVLQSGGAKITKAMTAQERDEERKLVGEMVLLNTQISQERMRPQQNQSRLDDLNARLKKARLEYETFQVKLYVDHPELKAQRGEAPLLKLEEAAALLPDATSALLEYVVADDKSHLFVLTKDEQDNLDFKTYTIELSSRDLAERTKAFRRQLAERAMNFRDSATALHNLLLKPAHAQLQGKTNLIIVPDGVLWELPFQALRSSDNHYLIERYALSYAPSLTVLREMKRLRETRRATDTPGSPVLLAMGNPTLGNETIARVKSVFRDEKLEPLPESEREVNALRRLYGAPQSKIYVGTEAREDRMKAEASNFRIVHLATHGILNDANPMYSQVLLSQAASKASEDGLLEAWEITKLNLNADLVVLSACETGRGRVAPGEGMIGLTWAMFVAGSPTTVVSQWKVGSTSTTQLMLEFHRNLSSRFRDNKPQVGISTALREAAVKMLRNKDTQHPFYWAGFVVVGDGR